MTGQTRQVAFKVDVAGIIEIMGTSLYSRADTPIRELIQNAHDAITRRRQKELRFQGRIDIVQDAAENTLTFSDNGIGLSEDEAEEYLSTLGVGITGLIKKGYSGPIGGDAQGLIGQFGIGMFSAFMLATRVTVDSKRIDDVPAVRWEAGAGTEIQLSPGSRTEPGTTITLKLKFEHRELASQPELLEKAIREYADFLSIPIFLNGGPQRVNVIQAAWFEPTPDPEAIELEFESYFGETPLLVIPIRKERPVSITGALYVSPQRVPGFSDDAVVTVTVRRMVISRKIQGLLPPWATFFRGVLELNDCSPTASREDLVRDNQFELARFELEEAIFEYLENLRIKEQERLEALIAWHRYSMAGAALEQRRLRELLRQIYKLPTSQGLMYFSDVVEKSPADPLIETESEFVIWYNTDRRQEAWLNSLFASQDVPCVHVFRSFEESLLFTWAADYGDIVLRPATPSSPNFSETILGARDFEPAPPAWQEFLASTQAVIHCADLFTPLPVLAFLNERHELKKTFDDLKQQGAILESFQRLIDMHFSQAPNGQHEIILNRKHRLVARALELKTVNPLASVLRLLVYNALATAGATIPRDGQKTQMEDLDWITEALWGKS